VTPVLPPAVVQHTLNQFFVRPCTPGVFFHGAFHVQFDIRNVAGRYQPVELLGPFKVDIALRGRLLTKRDEPAFCVELELVVLEFPAFRAKAFGITAPINMHPGPGIADFHRSAGE
jgi:hypothetical protein